MQQTIKRPVDLFFLLIGVSPRCMFFHRNIFRASDLVARVALLLPRGNRPIWNVYRTHLSRQFFLHSALFAPPNPPLPGRLEAPRHPCAREVFMEVPVPSNVDAI